ncbi:MAG: pyridoxal phosphate-dependent aminotransferase [Bacteroidetes bacterium]|nr:pyridoxal phosphate-dependent aminotransferase [Bacteroidota bacterium]
MFSSRLPDDLDENAVSRLLGERRSCGRPVIDLTLSNPTHAGFDYPIPEIREAIARGAERGYDPNPRGLPAAREAIAEYYSGEGEGMGDGERIDANAIVCTTSSSEAYSMLFKLLCEPGDEICIPHPAYPLFSWLAALDAVRVSPYNLRLAADGRWGIDMASLDMAITERTRAVIVVNPSNPAGNYLRPDEFVQLDSLCARRGIALITDEVFWDYPLEASIDAGNLRRRTAGISGEALRFTINGLSKLLALPQMKLGWMLVEGPARLCEEALARLDVIADAYLSVSTPVMAAAPALLGLRAVMQEQIRVRCASNLARVRALFAHDAMANREGTNRTGAASRATTQATLLFPEGGWSAMLALPADVDEEAQALRLLDEHGVLVHPGSLFDFPRGKFLVLSLLVRHRDFENGTKELVASLENPT